MSTAHANVGGGSSGIAGFFSSFQEILGNVQGIVSDVAPIFTGNTVNNPPNTNQPTYQGPTGTPTSGSPSTTIESQNTLQSYMPYLLIGGAVLIAVIALK